MRFIYLNSENLYPPDTHLIQGLCELGHEIIEITENKNHVTYHLMAQRLKKEEENCDAVFVGYPSPLLVIVTRFVTNKKIFFNAICSQYESNIISRNEKGFLYLRAIKSWIIDFLSFHLSTKVLLESNSQIEFVSKYFFVRKKKLVRSFMGVDERNFFYESNIPKLKNFTVLFRGRFLPESGILTVLEATKKLEGTGITVRVMGEGFMYREVNALIAKLQPKNLDMINKTLPFDELRKKMLECHISLGQLAIHPRLDRTLPSKLFESLALKLPYLTGRNKAVLEILEENVTCIASNPGDADDLVKKILYLRDHPEILKEVGENGFNLYKKNLTSKHLAQEVFNECFV